MPAELRIREAVRAVLLDPAGRVLLCNWRLPDEGSVWGAPGGGVESGEDAESALRRELAEELGLDDFVVGPPVWERTIVVPLLGGRWDGQHEHYFLVAVERFEPAPRFDEEQLRAEHLTGSRWWTVDELDGFTQTATQFFAPRRLPELLVPLRHGDVPAVPIDVGA